MRGEYMSHIVHLFYIWHDSTVEVGFDVRDMHARVGTSLMRSSSCSLKKKKHGIPENLGGGVCSALTLIQSEQNKSFSQ